MSTGLTQLPVNFRHIFNNIAQGAFAAGAATSGPVYDPFLEKFRDAGDADIHQWALAAYDAMTTALLAAQRGGEATPEAIERNLTGSSSCTRVGCSPTTTRR